MQYKILVSALLFGSSMSSYAVVCWNAKGEGVVDEVFYDLSNAFSSSNNVVGKEITLKRNFSHQLYGRCPVHYNPRNTTMRSYVTNSKIVETVGSYKYLAINDYLIGAMKIYDSYAKDFFPPQNYVQMGSDPKVSTSNDFPIFDSDFTFKIKVIKPFVDFVTIPKRTLFTVYVTTSNTDSLSKPVYTISYSGQITVPQSCKIDAGQVLDINFGDIPAYAFAQAGAGNQPAGTRTELRNLQIQCSNINATAALTLRLESEKSSNDIMVSDNPDIGFKMSDANGKVLIPNNINSVIPFNLTQQPVRIPLKAWPVSITGKTPQLGNFRSRGYLRVDFD
ncbi:minor fimbrial subunit [Acinetobacter calcoaceticus]|uniref:Minor fimbrial subunit n=1 Tax=Acinetobacter calcoaceticus TaxID=471 RepID=A0A4R1XZQ0_ACICA|nr:minor fimbrial subunit [Acinetobacter calcoaceticus]